MSTIAYFKILVMLFVTYCVYEFYIQEVYRIFRKSVFNKFTIVTVVMCLIVGVMGV